jgi:hypothetical protein
MTTMPKTVLHAAFLTLLAFLVLAPESFAGSVALSWNANPAGDNVTSYNIWREPFGTSNATEIAPAVTGTTYADNGLTDGTEWTYWITATNAYGVSAPSAMINVLVPQATGPCDVASQAGTPCIAAFSLERPMISTYGGPLFRVERTSDNATHDVGIVNGFWDSTTYNSFCGGTTCYFVTVYDQIAAGGPFNSGQNLNLINQVESASWLGLQPPIAGTTTLGGRTVPYFGHDVFNSGAVGYLTAGRRAGLSSNGQMPTGSHPITELAVFGGLSLPNAGTGSGLGGCCYQFGAMENTVTDDGAGTMFAISQDMNAGAGLFGIDTENNIAWADFTPSSWITSLASTNGTSTITLEAAQGGGTLTPLTADPGRIPYCTPPVTMHNAPLSCWQSGAFAMEGGLAAGINGDGTYYQSQSAGFIEGAVIAAATSDATNTAIQANISAFY